MLKSAITIQLWIGTAIAYKQSWANIGKTLTIDMGSNNTIKTHAKQTGMKFIQVSLQYSRAATANLMNAVAEDETDNLHPRTTHYPRQSNWNFNNTQNLHIRRRSL